MGPVCFSFSLDMTSPCAKCEPPPRQARPWMSLAMGAKFEEGSRLVQWCFSLVDLAVREWLGAWLENPASSWMFRLSECEELLRRTPSVGCRNYCRFGAAWRKQTLFLGNLPCIRYRRGLLELAGWMTSSWSTRNPWPCSTRFGMSSSLRSSTTLMRTSSEHFLATLSF